MIADYHYLNLISLLHHHGEEVETRNGRVKSIIHADPITFTETPLVTLRKTAWNKAIREMEWFMSGDPRCPDELLDWWNGQLNSQQCYLDGYGEQFRHFSDGPRVPFDQVAFILDGLRNHPYSRRLIMTAWNPADMASITQTNCNERTPTTCHSSFMQFFVREGSLHLMTVQRSCDVLLGLPHNWIQTWALLLYFANWSNLRVGSLRWVFGDLHLYQHSTHTDTVERLLTQTVNLDRSVCLCYNPSVENSGVPCFKGSDFVMQGEIPEPRVLTRPQLL
jgi:thymidylate synthase